MSTSSSPSYQPTFETSPPEPAVPAWKMELNAKLAAHRQRRPGSGADDSADTRRDGSARASASSVAARVAERYAKAPSYREFLAASAAAAAAAAETAAFAARQAHEAVDAFARLAAEGDPTEHPPEPAPAEVAGPTVAYQEPLPPRGVVPPRTQDYPPSLFDSHTGIIDPIAEATVPPAVSLPAKLIEFPRELVAARKSRPRVAEGPLAETPLFDQPADPLPSLRIFEVQDVEAASMSGEPAWDQREASTAPPPTGAEPHSQAYRQEPEPAPAWHSIRLGEHPSAVSAPEQTSDEKPTLVQEQQTSVLYTASLGDRTMAALVDFAVILGAFLLFVLVFASCTAHPPVNKTALVCAGVIFAGIALFYEWLFMSYGGGTLGMRYAQIAICTFDDDNPSRRVMRRRVAASLLSALPLGLGFLWAIFDEDSLSWHDRMTRSYQRSYR